MSREAARGIVRPKIAVDEALNKAVAARNALRTIQVGTYSCMYSEEAKVKAFYVSLLSRLTVCFTNCTLTVRK